MIFYLFYVAAGVVYTTYVCLRAQDTVDVLDAALIAVSAFTLWPVFPIADALDGVRSARFWSKVIYRRKRS